MFVVCSLAIAAYVTFLTAKGGLSDDRRKWWRRLTRRGRKVWFFSLLGIGVVFTQELNLQRKNDVQENQVKKNNRERDSIITAQVNAGVDLSRRKLFADLSEALAKQGFRLDTVSKNLDKIQNVSRNELLERLYQEYTGGDAVPVVHAKLYFNSWNSYTSRYKDVPKELRNKFVVDVFIENEGKFPLNNINASCKHSFARIYKEDTIPKIDHLRPKESKILIPTFQANADPIHSVRYLIRIKWEVEYTYVLVIQNKPVFDSTSNRESNKFSIDQSYTYKGITYKNSDDFKLAIKSDLNSAYRKK